jgi:hypothetical protein
MDRTGRVLHAIILVCLGSFPLTMIQVFNEKHMIGYALFALFIVALTPLLILKVPSNKRKTARPSAGLVELISYFSGVALSIVLTVLISYFHRPI